MRYRRIRILSILILTICFFCACENQEISLRPFPYPYRAGLALCSDIDCTDSVQEFLTIQEYLCTRKQTLWGSGLGLEVGNSFWFYDYSGISSFTVFDSSGQKMMAAGKVIDDFIRAGYIDCLHTYGDFNDEDHSFDAEMAKKALAYFQQNDFSIPVWVNHGNQNNTQCIGPFDYQMGDNPGCKEYHAFLLKDFGIHYMEIWKVTHRVSLDNTAGLKDTAWGIYEFFFSIWDAVRSGRMDLITGNKLIEPITLDDGQNFWRFRRFINDDGKITQYGVDAQYLSRQLKSSTLDRLTKAGGYQIVYTHLGANEESDEVLPKATRAVLQDLSDRFHRGEILITTTSRLLDYNRITRFIRWTWSKSEEDYRIEISGIADPLQTDSLISVEQLRGLTFYTPFPEKTEIYLQGEPVSDTQVYPEDQTGKSSVGIPWDWLQYPQGY